MVDSGSYTQPITLVQSELNQVRQTLSQLGAEDGPFLHHVISTLVTLPGDLWRPTVAALTADLLGSSGDKRMLSFAVAIQAVYAASLAHGKTGLPSLGERDHLTVLAGDYLYAQAAVLTAGLKQLTVMALLAEAIKNLCHDGSTPGLFRLSTEGTGHLLACDETRLASVSHYGSLLDDIVAQPHAHSSVRAAAIHALSGIEDSAARRALIEVAQDVHASSMAAALSLHRYPGAPESDRVLYDGADGS